MTHGKKNPTSDALLLQGKMARLFDDLRQRTLGNFSSGAWFPPVDIFETSEHIVLKAELPGFDAKHVSIEVDGNVLTLNGERKFDKNTEDENYLRMERFYGTFQRAFNLPKVVDKTNIKAGFKDGVLKISIPKASGAAPGAIKIKVS